MSQGDKTIRCRGCGKSFLFTVGEQEFYARKGFTSDPSRCPHCRAARKANRDGDNSGDWHERRERQMHPIVCAACGKAAEVPFEPQGDRPVYCFDCYQTHRTTSHRF